jgi:hypothetical protein
VRANSFGSSPFFFEMKNCWKILGIEPTNDAEVVKKAYRTLMKRWHPDTVMDPEIRKEYTTRSAEINAAYDEATRFAESWAPGMSTSPGATDAATPGHIYSVRYEVGGTGCLTFFVLIVVFYGMIRYLSAAWMMSFISGLVASAILNTAFYRVVMKRRPAPRNVNWLLLMVMNAAIAGLYQSVGGNPAFAAGIALTIPLWVFWKR